MSQPTPLVWIDGALRSPADATISPWDHGLTVGDGVFETMKVIDGRAFAVRRHLDRLRRSARGLGFEVPLDDGALRDAIESTIGSNGLRTGRLRLTVTGGVGPLGSDRGEGRPTVMMAVGPLVSRGEHAAVATVPWRRNEHSAVAGLKTTSYAENVVALRRAHDNSADEAILANTAGDLCEGTGSNIFVEIDGRLVTPPLSSGCLAGITRELVLEVVDADEVSVAFSTLDTCEEAFLTSSTRDVQPIAVIDGRRLDAPGPHTRRTIQAFAELEARTFDP